MAEMPAVAHGSRMLALGTSLHARWIGHVPCLMGSVLPPAGLRKSRRSLGSSRLKRTAA